MTAMFKIERLGQVDAPALEQLCEVLEDCVAGGASVSFMSPLTRQTAMAFWRRVAEGVAAGERMLYVARASSGAIVGTVQVVLDLPENQPHRGDVAKMLVHRSARRQGLGAALLAAAETGAREVGRSLLVLDTVTGGDAERMYQRSGWQRCGVIPGYALHPDGRPCGTTVFWKQLDSPVP